MRNILIVFFILVLTERRIVNLPLATIWTSSAAEATTDSTSNISKMGQNNTLELELSTMSEEENSDATLQPLLSSTTAVQSSSSEVTITNDRATVSYQKSTGKSTIFLSEGTNSSLSSEEISTGFTGPSSTGKTTVFTDGSHTNPQKTVAETATSQVLLSTSTTTPLGFVPGTAETTPFHNASANVTFQSTSRSDLSTSGEQITTAKLISKQTISTSWFVSAVSNSQSHTTSAMTSSSDILTTDIQISMSDTSPPRVTLPTSNSVPYSTDDTKYSSTMSTATSLLLNSSVGFSASVEQTTIQETSVQTSPSLGMPTSGPSIVNTTLSNTMSSNLSTTFSVLFASDEQTTIAETTVKPSSSSSAIQTSPATSPAITTRSLRNSTPTRFHPTSSYGTSTSDEQTTIAETPVKPSSSSSRIPTSSATSSAITTLSHSDSTPTRFHSTSSYGMSTSDEQTTVTETTPHISSAHSTTPTPSSVQPTNEVTIQSSKFPTTTVPSTAVLTTLEISTTTTRPSTTTRHTTTTPQKEYVPDIDKLDVNVELDIVLLANYSEELSNNNSDLYQSYKCNFTVSLRIAYNNTPGFKDVEVLGFRDFSDRRVKRSVARPSGIVVDHKLILYGDVDIKQSMEKLKTEIVYEINHVIREHTSILLNENATKESIQDKATTVTEQVESGELCILYVTPCGIGYVCLTRGDHIICRSLCVGETKCGNNGQCYLEGRDTKCRCTEDTKYIYTGTLCDIRTEKNKSEDTKVFIAISVGISGGVLLLLLAVITVVLCKRKRRRRKRNDHTREEAFDSLYLHTYGEKSEDVRINRYGNKCRRNDNDSDHRGNDYVRYTRSREEMYDVIPVDVDESAQNRANGNDGYLDLSGIECSNTTDSYISSYYRRQKNDGYSDIYSGISSSQADDWTAYRRSTDRNDSRTTAYQDYLRPTTSDLNTFKSTSVGLNIQDNSTIIYRGPQSGWR